MFDNSWVLYKSHNSRRAKRNYIGSFRKGFHGATLPQVSRPQRPGLPLRLKSTWPPLHTQCPLFLWFGVGRSYSKFLVSTVPPPKRRLLNAASGPCRKTALPQKMNPALRQARPDSEAQEGKSKPIGTYTSKPSTQYQEHTLNRTLNPSTRSASLCLQARSALREVSLPLYQLGPRRVLVEGCLDQVGSLSF